VCFVCCLLGTSTAVNGVTLQRLVVQGRDWFHACGLLGFRNPGCSSPVLRSSCSCLAAAATGAVATAAAFSAHPNRHRVPQQPHQPWCVSLSCAVLYRPQFKDWFSNPLTGAVETGQEVSRQLVERLHGVLRPFLLRCENCVCMCVQSSHHLCVWCVGGGVGAVETGQEVSRQLVERLHDVLRPFLLRYACCVCVYICVLGCVWGGGEACVGRWCRVVSVNVLAAGDATARRLAQV
jgi:hypothetical protein